MTRATTALLSAALLSALAPLAAAQYTVTTLQPGAGFQETFVQGVGGTQQVGFGSGLATGGNTHALLWSGTSATIVDLNPTGTYFDPPVPISGSFAYGAGGGQQVGKCIAGPRDAAALWTGTAASVVFLHTADMNNSNATDTDGVNQVGLATSSLFAGTHAFAWSGTAASAVDLHPVALGFPESFAYGVSGGRAAGALGTDDGFYQAVLWTTLDPASAVLLHRPEWLESAANTVRGGVVGGQAYPDGQPWHATLWTNGGADVADLHPAGFFSSFILDMNATRQVGLAATTPDPVTGVNHEHAFVWAGTAASAVDLHPFVAAALPGYTDSKATGIDDAGNIYGYATVDGTNYVAVRWTPAAAAAPCCRGSLCSLETAAACAITVPGARARAAAAAGAACNPAGLATAPCCKADYNKAGGVELLDIFDFLTDWFNGVQYADFTAAAGVDLLDIFAFLEAWFAGGC